MKMNLSVVMGIVDKASAPLKTMSEESNHYAKVIGKLQAKQKDDTAALGMIDAFKGTKKAMDDSSLSIATATEKLDALKAKAAAAKKPSAALTEQIAKQQQRLDKLNTTQDESKQHLVKLGKQLKKAGVKMHDLDGESARLNQSYKKHGNEITKLSKKYTLLQGAMKPVRALNKRMKMPSIEGVKNTALAGAGALGVVAGLGVVVSDTAHELDALSRAAKDVKMPVGELQALRMQAKLAGAESEDMDAAIKEMMLRWGEMKTLKSGAMNDYFLDTGNKAAYDDLMNAKDATEAYQVLLREIAQETDQAKQNFMADEFFGGDSEKMLSVLKGGITGYQEAKQLLEESGGAVTKEATDNATMFASSLKKLSAIVDSLKISALTPIMAELSKAIEELAINMRDIKWRNEAIEQLRGIVKGTFEAFKALGKGIFFVVDNFKEIVAIVALLKIGMVALNAVMMANPISWMAVGISAAVVAVGYLISKLVDFKKLWSGITSFFSDDESEKVNEMVKTTKDLKNKNIEMGITTNERTKTTKRTKEPPRHYGYQTGALNSSTPYSYQPLTNQTIQSKSEVALTIKSEKPVTIDKADSGKGTNLNLDVGNMAFGY